MASFFLSDEEMGKKDDDHSKKPTGIIPPIRPNPKWSPARAPLRKTVRRIIMAIAAGVAIYLFIANIPTDLPIRDRRRPTYIHPNDEADIVPPPKRDPALAPNSKPPPPPKEGAKKAEEPAQYNGPIRFLNLAPSLHGISGTQGTFAKNKNILFAASSLQSLSGLLPMACQMGTELRSYVHVALMGRSEIDIDELREINGVDESCQLIFHDARPEFAAASTEARLEYSVKRALYHINIYMHPQAVLIDGSSTEERFFINGLREEAKLLEVPLIEVPKDGLLQLGWMSKLDSAALSAWNKVSIDILIHASAGTAGSLIRLLRSLSAADYTSCSAPHLTIELPKNVDAATEEFLRSFQWPPAHVYNPTKVRQLSLRHRIPRASLNEEESSVRFLESFWPANEKDNHVLVLTPQAELSPSFYHYLKYSLLTYRYSGPALLEEWDKRLMGISLELPSTFLNASETLKPPVKGDVAQSPGVRADDPTAFLWQAPNSNAILYMGDKWAELHSFVSRYIEARSRLYTIPPFFQQKHVSKRYPSWLEHALKLARARGYWTLYPSERTASNLAAIHTDLYKAPEEYDGDLEMEQGPIAEVALASISLLDSLPDRGNLPTFDDLPLLKWDGDITTLEQLDGAAIEYVAEFRRAIGGCEELAPEDLMRHKSTKDLFCTKDE
ncbi:hypothetical protein GQ53DRAFT_755739 [Thozetella sp. PMI_491]|nr:hypothetical protein GQ53DRAFT_755739 [Thozetella sp. PMI_491]